MVGHRGIELEPLAAGVGSDFYRQMLDPAGGMSIHHLGFHVPDVDAWAERLVASTKGRASLWVRGRLAVWPTRIDFDGGPDRGSLALEFTEVRFDHVPPDAAFEPPVAPEATVVDLGQLVVPPMPGDGVR